MPTAGKPQMACLSSRIPYGEPVTKQKLMMIEAAENFLRDLGFYDVRVRHHELQSRTDASPVSPRPEQAGHLTCSLARIEVGQGEIPKLLANETFTRVAAALKKIGYAHVTLDLQGYRRGNLNEQSLLRHRQPT